MLVSAKAVRGLLPSPHGVLYVLVWSLRLFVWRDVALAATLTWHSGME